MCQAELVRKAFARNGKSMHDATHRAVWILVRGRYELCKLTNVLLHYMTAQYGDGVCFLVCKRNTDLGQAHGDGPSRRRDRIRPDMVDTAIDGT